MANRSHGTLLVPKPARIKREAHLTDVRDQRAWAVSPTDLAFLWADCPRCFYRKVVWGVPRPRGPFPLVFNRIDRAMKHYFAGQRTEGLGAGVPSGVIGGVDRSVRSAPIAPPGSASPLVIRGRVDALVARDDDTVAVIDFKTAEPGNPNLAAYSRQLHAYATALEHPASGRPVCVSAMGLLCFSPQEFEVDGNRGALTGGVSWIAVERDQKYFEDLLDQVAETLTRGEAPAPTPGCPWCLSRANTHAA